jgi:DNA-binding transcriptional regulator YdaS (Cro superfamily)
MTPEDLQKQFGTQLNIARALGVSAPSVSLWFSNKRVPLLRQYQVEKMTRGRLKADESQTA